MTKHTFLKSNDDSNIWFMNCIVRNTKKINNTYI